MAHHQGIGVSIQPMITAEELHAELHVERQQLTAAHDNCHVEHQQMLGSFLVGIWKNRICSSCSQE